MPSVSLTCPTHSQTTLSFVSDSHCSFVRILACKWAGGVTGVVCRPSPVHTHSFCCPIVYEICISVMLANSGNRSARRHGYSLQHSSPVPICFTLLPVLSITWPWNDLPGYLCIPISSSLSVNRGHEKSGGKEFDSERFTSVSTWKRADIPVASSQAHVRLSFRICLAMLSSARSVLHWARTHSRSQHCLYSIMMFDSPYYLSLSSRRVTGPCIESSVGRCARVTIPTNMTFSL